MWPRSGIWVSSPAAVTRDTPGIDVRISVRRASPSSSTSRFLISVSMAARCRSSCASRCVCGCCSNRCRPGVWRFRAAVRSLTSASPRHLQCLEGALRRRRGRGGPQVHRGAHLRQHPRVHRVGLGPLAEGLRKAPRVHRVDTHQRQPALEPRFLEGAVPPSGRLVGDGANRHRDPRDQRLESRRVIGEPRGVKSGPKLDQSGGGKLDHPAARWRV